MLSSSRAANEARVEAGYVDGNVENDQQRNQMVLLEHPSLSDVNDRSAALDRADGHTPHEGHRIRLPLQLDVPLLHRVLKSRRFGPYIQGTIALLVFLLLLRAIFHQQQQSTPDLGEQQSQQSSLKIRTETGLLSLLREARLMSDITSSSSNSTRGTPLG